MVAARTLDEVLASVSDALFPAELGEHPVSLDSRGYDGDSPLHVLCWRGDVEGARVVLQAGATVDPIGEMGQNPLHVAVMRGDVALTKLLVDAGANPDIRTEFGDTAGELAARRGGPIAEPLAGVRSRRI
jgi:uncharacterized protein